MHKSLLPNIKSQLTDYCHLLPIHNFHQEKHRLESLFYLYSSYFTSPNIDHTLPIAIFELPTSSFQHPSLTANRGNTNFFWVLLGQSKNNQTYTFMDNDFLMNFTAAIVAIINPIGLVPIWKELLGDTDRKVRIRVAFMVISSSMFLLLIFLIFGKPLLQFFQIDLVVFKVAGGVLLLFTGISMVDGKITQLKARDEKGETSLQIAKQRFKKVLVPLTIPMLVGPGSITTVIIYGSRAQGAMEYVELSLVLISVLLVFLFILCYSHYIERKLDDLIFIIFTRIFGVIVVAIALQFILEGLADVFPAWVDASSAIMK